MTSHSRIARTFLLFANVAAVAALTGCSIPGKWTLAKVDPTAATRNAEFHSLTLQKDGSFYAEAKEAGGIKTTSGTYTYKHGVLDLVAHDGERHTYDAKMLNNNDLRLATTWQGKKLKLKYDRDLSE